MAKMHSTTKESEEFIKLLTSDVKGLDDGEVDTLLKSFISNNSMNEHVTVERVKGIVYKTYDDKHKVKKV